MFLFSRSATLTGSPRRTMAFASEVTAYVNANSALEVTCWSNTFGFPIGTLTWSAMVESQAAFANATGALLAQGAYLDLLESAADLFTIPGQDALLRAVHGGQAGDPPPLGAVARVVNAQPALDRLGEAVEWSVGTAQYLETLTGMPTAVFVDSFGAYGAVNFITVVPDMAAYDTWSDKLVADTGFRDRLSQTGGVFLPGSVHASQHVRVV